MQPIAKPYLSDLTPQIVDVAVISYLLFADQLLLVYLERRVTLVVVMNSAIIARHLKRRIVADKTTGTVSNVPRWPPDARHQITGLRGYGADTRD